jgi:16S rRNA (guanine527-N7)-methyltransferase
VKHPQRGAWSASRETTEKLDSFINLVITWNRAINLISTGDERTIRQRHLDDSLALLPFLPEDFDRAIDLGSGAGFPAIPLALATGRHFDLVESDRRKAAFLNEAGRVTGAPVTVHTQRIEQAKLVPAPLVTARALAPLPQLLIWATPLLAPGGVCVFPKGRSAEEELTRASRQWHMRVERWPSPHQPESLILRLSELSRV